VISASRPQSKAERDRRIPYEKAVSDGSVDSSANSGYLSEERLQAWLSYIQYEKQRSENAFLVVVLYERALCACFLHADVWLAYGDFVRDRVGAATLCPLHRRAVRNVPTSCELWCGLVRSSWSPADSERLHSILDDAIVALQGKAGSGGGGSAVVALCVEALAFGVERAVPGRWTTSRLLTTAECAIRYCDASFSLQPRHVNLCIDLFTFWYREGDRRAARTAMMRWVKEQAHTARTWSALLRLEAEAEAAAKVEGKDFCLSTYPTSARSATARVADSLSWVS
jgi:hypothetical protein